jgi:hypothetical protein
MFTKTFDQTWIWAKGPITIYLDSQSAIALSENPKYHLKASMLIPNTILLKKKKLENKFMSNILLLYPLITNIWTKSLPQEKHYLCMEFGMCTLLEIISKPHALIYEVDAIPAIQGSIHAIVICIKLKICNNSYNYSSCDSLFQP